MTAPINQEPLMVSSTFMHTGALDPSALSRIAWMNDLKKMEEPMDFSTPMYGFENFNNYDQVTVIDPMSMDPNDARMRDWNNTGDLDFSSFLQNSVGA